MAYRLCYALVTLRSQINVAFPHRSKVSDGWIGDAAHSSRKSDHNPNSAGVVCAIDVTHDPSNGCNSRTIAESLRNGRDSRIGYVISAGKIFSSTRSPWIWRTYNGSNGHYKHVHVSARQVSSLYDNGASWNISGVKDFVEGDRALRLGDRGADVAWVQRVLGINNDGIFGPATEAAVKAFQSSKGLTADGIVGTQTWAALRNQGIPDTGGGGSVAISDADAQLIANKILDTQISRQTDLPSGLVPDGDTSLRQVIAWSDSNIVWQRRATTALENRIRQLILPGSDPLRL